MNYRPDRLSFARVQELIDLTSKELDTMKVLIVGSGGREHALCWKLRQSSRVSRLFCAPGNPGIAQLASCVPIRVDDLQGLLTFTKAEQIDLTIVGPEVPLTLGIVDLFQEQGLKIFGPTRAAAEIEGSKAFAKSVMQQAGVCTAGYRVIESAAEGRSVLAEFNSPYVIKCDSLAAGKGVFICNDAHEAQQAIESCFTQLNAPRVVIEEFLQGFEASLIVLAHSEQFVALPAAHDYKRLQDGDQGPNTGGMGTVCPTPRMTPALTAQALDQVIAPVLKQLVQQATPFTGFLYAGLMINPATGLISVVEFNCRFGDPEAQTILTTMQGDLLELIEQLLAGNQPLTPPTTDSAVCVVLASGEYPDRSGQGDIITGCEFAQQLPNALVFHSGTTLNEQNQLVTNGGRILSVVGTGPDLESARRTAYRAVDMLQFKGRQCRRDIGIS